MRLVSFRRDGGPRVEIGAFIHDDREIVAFGAARPDDAALQSMQALIDGGDEALARAGALHADAVAGGRTHVLPSEGVELLAPLPVPMSIRDWACFPEHMVNMRRNQHRALAAREPDPAAAMARFEREGKFAIAPDYYTLPRFHACNRFNVVATGHDVEWPPFTEQMDFELEFGYFIGRRGRRIPESQAREHIFGYTVFNDYTARDYQRAEARIGGKCKEFDTGSVMGPCIVTRDEIPDPYDLRMVARVNGQVVADTSSRTIGNRFEHVIAHISEATTLYPGEFFGSGTVGTGCGAEFDRYLSDGDVVELEVERIGRIRNRVVRTR